MLSLKLITRTPQIWLAACLLFLGISSQSKPSEDEVKRALAQAVTATFSEDGANSLHIKLLYDKDQRRKLENFTNEVSRDLIHGNMFRVEAYDHWVVNEVVGKDFFHLLNFYLGRADVPKLVRPDLSPLKDNHRSHDLGWIVALKFREEDLASQPELREKSVILFRSWVAFVDQIGMFELISERMLGHYAGFFSTLDVIAGSDQIVGRLELKDINTISKFQKSAIHNQGKFKDQDLKDLAEDTISSCNQFLKTVLRSNHKFSAALSAYRVSRMMSKLTLLQKEQAGILMQDALISDCLKDADVTMRDAPEIWEWVSTQIPMRIEGDSLELLGQLESSLKLWFNKDKRLPLTTTLIEGVRSRIRIEAGCCGK